MVDGRGVLLPIAILDALLEDKRRPAETVAAHGVADPDSPAAQERLRHAQVSMTRLAKLPPLIDERKAICDLRLPICD